MDNNYKKATHIVVLVELIIDYALMFGSLLAAVLIFFNMGTLVNATVDGAMNSAYTSASASGSSGGELGQAVGAVAVGVFSSLFFAVLSFFLVIFALIMIFPVVTMHCCLSDLNSGAEGKKVIKSGVIAMIALQIPAATMMLVYGRRLELSERPESEAR